MFLSNRFRKFQRAVWPLILVTFFLFRLTLTSHDAILPITSDSQNYALQTNHYLSNSQFAYLPPQAPGLPIVARGVRQLGIPYKLFLDLSLTGLAIVAATVSSRFTRSYIVGVIVLFLIGLNPWFYGSSKLFMSEPLLALILLALVLFSYPFFLLPLDRWKWRGLLAVTTASVLYSLVRCELPIVLCYWILAGVVILLVQRKRLRSNTVVRWRKLKIAWVVIPFLTSCAATEYVKSLHYEKYHIRAMALPYAPGVKAIMSALYSVPPDEEIQFAPVTIQTLESACQVSPTFNSVREKLLDPDAPSFGHAKRHLQLEGQVGTWLNWHLLRAFGGANEKSNQKMLDAAAEIREAQRKGTIGKRSAFYPVNPLWKVWLPQLAPEIWEQIVISTLPRRQDMTHSIKTGRPGQIVTDAVIYGFFDDGLLRRQGIGEKVTYRINAWSTDTHFRRARLCSSDGATMANTRIRPGSGNRKEISFELAETPAEDQPIPGYIELFHHQSEPERTERIDLTPNAFRQFQSLQNREPFECWRLSTSTIAPHNVEDQVTQNWFRKHWPLLYGIGTGIVFLVGLMSRIGFMRRKRLGYYTLVAVFFLIGRASFLALIEVWLSWSKYRYSEPNCLFTTLAIVCLSFWLGVTIRKLTGKAFPATAT